MAEMLEGVQIILERMKTNPEEFDQHGKWGWLVSLLYEGADKYPLTDEEVSAIKDGLLVLNRERFNRRVFNCLLHEPTPETVGEQLYLPYMTPFSTSGTNNPAIQKARLKQAILDLSRIQREEHANNND